MIFSWVIFLACMKRVVTCGGHSTLDETFWMQAVFKIVVDHHWLKGVKMILHAEGFKLHRGFNINLFHTSYPQKRNSQADFHIWCTENQGCLVAEILNSYWKLFYWNFVTWICYFRMIWHDYKRLICWNFQFLQAVLGERKLFLPLDSHSEITVNNRY